MKRPLGITLSAVALGLLLVTLLGTLAALAAAVLADRHHRGDALFGFAFVAIPLAVVLVWLGMTLAGLLRLRSSARTSMQVLAVLLVLFALVDFVIALIIVAAAQAHSRSMLAYSLGAFAPGAFSLALGIWWLFYFNLRAVSTLFQPAWLRSGQPPASPYAVPRYASSVPGSRPGLPVGIPAPYPTRRPGRFERVPTSVQILAWLLLFGAAVAWIAALTPLPVFLGGSVFSGLAGHLLWLVLGAFTGLCGWGLLFLKPWSLFLGYLILLLASLNVLIALTPRAIDNLNLYAEHMLQLFHIPGQPELHFRYTLGLLLPSTVFGLVLYGAAAWFLHKHRALFTRPITGNEAIPS